MTKAKKPLAGPRKAKQIAEPPPVVVAPVEPSAQGDGNPSPMNVDDKIAALRSELLDKIAPPQSEPEAITFDERGRCIAPKGSRELFIRVGGARYEHVGETEDGRWVYEPS